MREVYVRRRALLEIKASSLHLHLSPTFGSGIARERLETSAVVHDLLQKDDGLLPVRPDAVWKDDRLGRLNFDGERLDEPPFGKGDLTEAHGVILTPSLEEKVRSE
jgi:hypothetical protein